MNRIFLLSILFLLLSPVFRVSGQNKSTDTRQLVKERYGVVDAELSDAWAILLANGYSLGEEIFRPGTELLAPGLVSATREENRTQRNLLPALDLLNRCLPRLKNNSVFIADLQNLTSESLNLYLTKIRLKCAHSLVQKEKTGFARWSSLYLSVFKDLKLTVNGLPGNKPAIIAGGLQQQWATLFRYAANCIASHQKYSEGFIQGQLPGVYPVRNTVHAQQSLPAESKLLHEVYLRNLDMDIGFE